MARSTFSKISRQAKEQAKIQESYSRLQDRKKDLAERENRYKYDNKRGHTDSKTGRFASNRDVSANRDYVVKLRSMVDQADKQLFISSLNHMGKEISNWASMVTTSAGRAGAALSGVFNRGMATLGRENSAINLSNRIGISMPQSRVWSRIMETMNINSDADMIEAWRNPLKRQEIIEYSEHLSKTTAALNTQESREGQVAWNEMNIAVEKFKMSRDTFIDYVTLKLAPAVSHIADTLNSLTKETAHGGKITIGDWFRGTAKAGNTLFGNGEGEDSTGGILSALGLGGAATLIGGGLAKAGATLAATTAGSTGMTGAALGGISKLLMSAGPFGAALAPAILAGQGAHSTYTSYKDSKSLPDFANKLHDRFWVSDFIGNTIPNWTEKGLEAAGMERGYFKSPQRKKDLDSFLEDLPNRIIPQNHTNINAGGIHIHLQGAVTDKQIKDISDSVEMGFNQLISQIGPAY